MKIHFATLAYGARYRLHAQRLCKDLAEFAPEMPILVLTDRPSEFFSFGNAIVESYRPEGILRRYHDKRLLIEHILDRQGSCIVIDANSRICEPLPDVITPPEGITGFLTMSLEQHLLEEDENPSRKGSGIGSATHARFQIERAAATLGVKISDVSFIQESIYSVIGAPTKVRAFIKCWGKLGAFFDYHGMAWSESYGIGLAAAKYGLPIHQNQFIPINSFYKHRIHNILIERGLVNVEHVIRARQEVNKIQSTRFSMLPSSLERRYEKGKMGIRWLLSRMGDEPGLD